MFRKKKNNLGFTLVEMLLVVAITVVLLSISMVGLAAHSKQLKMTELDNTAKEIYMAAQNRAILLSGSEKLGEYVKIKEDGQEDKYENELTTEININGTVFTEKTYYVDSESSIINKVLPKTSVDPQIWNGRFYIVYEPKSGSVTDVFYFEDEAPAAALEDFSQFYGNWREKTKDDRMNNEPMIGYYGGDFAESEDIVSLGTPVINIKNGDDLEAEIIYEIPAPLIAVESIKNNLKFNAVVTYGYDETKKGPYAVSYSYGYSQLKVLENNSVNKSRLLSCSIILDSLTGDEKFKDLFKSVQGFGEDFTVTAGITYGGDDIKLNTIKKSATDNSLFADGTTDNTAKISCTRHLQNLDKSYSGVLDSIVSAEQTGNIISPEYNFKPIVNSKIKSYDGGIYYIKGLNMTRSENAGNFGMFETFTGESESSRAALKNIRLVNASCIDEAENSTALYVGSLAGKAEYVDIEKCFVYWEEGDDGETLIDMLGDSDNGLNYKVSAENATIGGLLGMASNCNISKSFASQLVSGRSSSSSIVGGLIGEANDTTIISCYSSSYLAEAPKIGGLIGNAGRDISIEKSYAAGFVENMQNDLTFAAGLALGDLKVKVKVKDSYSAVRFIKDGIVAQNYTLCQYGDYTNVYYLNSGAFGFLDNEDDDDKREGKKGVKYEQLSDGWEELFGDVFEKKTVSTSHPYNLQTKYSLNEYVYPGINGVDHYGDFIAQFQNGGMVYYEKYKNDDPDGDDIFGFSGGNVNALLDNKTVLTDGFAVAYSEVAIQDSYTLEYSCNDKSKTVKYNGKDIKTVEAYDDLDGKIKEYDILILPDEFITGINTAPENFYSKIKTTDGASSGKTYFYNPHFANVPLPAADESSDAPQALNLAVEIRTARHFNMLSKYPNYYASKNQYNFRQGLDIDARTYTGYEGLFGGKTLVQEPIGKDKAFNGRYLGNSHTIKGITFKTKDDKEKTYNNIGLFAASSGTLRDIVYMPNNAMENFSEKGIGQYVYAGGLVGNNDGVVSNCAVSGIEFTAFGYESSTIYAGGLVGRNRGDILNSSADVKNINIQTTLSNAYAGGFVGRNDSGGNITRCYSVGKVFASQARSGSVVVTGFAADNIGYISKSYSANDLKSEGTVEIYGFGRGSGTTNCYYLNDGNFSYNNENYTAQYIDKTNAKPATWTQLKGTPASGETEILTGLGMNVGAALYGSNENKYPYPSGVKDAKGGLIHYGLYPDVMDLGDMGIYYWETMETRNVNPNGTYEVTSTSYHLSTLAYDSKNDKAIRNSTLSEAHNDNGVIVDYGYGYFYKNETTKPEIASSTSLCYKSTDIGNNDITFDKDDAEEVRNANIDKELKALMHGKYNFASYNTFDVESKVGLYAADYKGTLTNGNHVTPSAYLTVGGKNYYLNPFFADSMSLEDNLGKDANPFSVRSVEQLQFINWNDYYKHYNRAYGETKDNAIAPHLVYLDATKATRALVWKQTHDIDGSYMTEDGTDLKFFDYTPIAAIHDKTSASDYYNANAYFWFGGTYNGQDYTIKEININNNNANEKYETTGLFGLTVNADLRNIIMYSPSGKATIKAGNRDSSGNRVTATTHNGTSLENAAEWYAIGGLVGVAAKSEDTGKIIANCSVSGYKIIDEHDRFGPGGGCVGGLIGVGNMEIKECSAVNNIVIDFRFKTNRVNVRVGGLVGSTQQSVRNCYTGGSITFGDDYISAGEDMYTRLHIGGISGGYFFLRNLRCTNYKNNADFWSIKTNVDVGSGNEDVYLKDDAEVIYENCYTYVDIENIPKRDIPIPSGDTVGSEPQPYPSHIYAIGGFDSYVKAEARKYRNKRFAAKYNVATYVNCYVLQTCQKGEASNIYFTELKAKNNPIDDDQAKEIDITVCTYQQLEKDGTSYKKLLEAGFGELTTVSATGESIDGRFSFGTAGSLLGSNYPFPTILTQKSDIALNGVANIHYGNWPTLGIERENGMLPIDMDLFADYKSGEGAVFTEKLSISGIDDKNGIWKSETKNQIVEVLIQDGNSAGEKLLKVTALKKGIDTITIKYTVGSKEYSTQIAVNVTADLNITSNGTVVMFKNSKAAVPLVMKDKKGNIISEELRQLITINKDKFSAEVDRGFFAQVDVKSDENGIVLNVEGNNTDSLGAVRMPINYSYKYKDVDYEASSSIGFNFINLNTRLSDNFKDGIVFNFEEDPSKEELTVNFATSDIILGEESGSEDEIQIEGLSISGSANNSKVISVGKDEETGGLKINAIRPTEEDNIQNVAVNLEISFEIGTNKYTTSYSVPVKFILQEQM